MQRRDFVKTLSAAGAALYASDLVGDLVAQSSRGQVLIRGSRHPLVGRVCMDQFMVDIGPRGSAWNEDEVVLVGSQGDDAIAVEALAALAGTIPYEILTGLNERIPREYIGRDSR